MLGTDKMTIMQKNDFKPHPPSGDKKAACLLALDLGLTTGWAYQANNGLITSGTVNFKPSRYEGGGIRYLRFSHWLDEMLTLCERVDALFFEEVRAHRGVDAAHIYGGFLSHLTAACEKHSLPYVGVPVGTLKKHITGRGNADKNSMVKAVSALGYHPQDDNEADALALLLWAREQKTFLKSPSLKGDQQ